MSKPCPQCRKLNNIEARICTCGFWFINPNEGIEIDGHAQARREELKRKIKKYLVLSAYVLLVAGAAAGFGGFLSFPWISDESEKSDSRDELTTPSRPAHSSRNLTGGELKNIIDGHVTQVVDGETITVTDENDQEYKIKLGGIDAPALDENFGAEAKENLANLVLDKPVLVILHIASADGVRVGKVLLEGINVNLEQVKAGLARIEKDSAEEQSEFDRQLFLDAEIAAQTNRTGLWSGINPIAKTENIEPVNRDAEAKISVGKESSTVKLVPDSSSFSKNQPLETKSAVRSEQPVLNDNVNAPVSRSLTTSSTPITEPVIDERKTNEQRASATARCLDGTFSYSSTRQGACSRHGGVAAWLNGTVSPAKTTSNSVRGYQRGIRGGCYYINSNGNKTYVDRSVCN